MWTRIGISWNCGKRVENWRKCGEEVGPRVPRCAAPSAGSCDLIGTKAVHHVGDGTRFHRGEFLLENNTG